MFRNLSNCLLTSEKRRDIIYLDNYLNIFCEVEDLGFAETFKALSDPTRREILNLLKKGNLSAGEIGGHFEMTGATISHHLSILKQADLIHDRKEGKYIYYELNLSVFEEILSWLNGFLKDKNPESHDL